LPETQFVLQNNKLFQSNILNILMAFNKCQCYNNSTTKNHLKTRIWGGVGMPFWNIFFNKTPPSKTKICSW
jgi:hypothetical protein